MRFVLSVVIVVAACVPVWLALALTCATVLPQSLISLPVVASKTAMFSSTAEAGQTTSQAPSAPLYTSKVLVRGAIS